MMYWASLSLVARFSIDENTLLASQTGKVAAFYFACTKLKRENEVLDGKNHWETAIVT